MEEVASHIKPFKDSIEKMDRWRVSLWSNGSGGPPGYLEVARAEDEKRYARLSAEQREATSKLETVETFITLLKDRQQRHSRYWQIVRSWGWKVFTAAAAALLSLTGWAYHEISPVLRILWQDYLRAHPLTSEDLQKMSGNFDPTTAKVQPLDASRF